MFSEIDHLLEYISETLGVDVKQESLSSRAVKSLTQCGSSWVRSAIEAILVAHPNMSVELKIVICETEPMINENSCSVETSETIEKALDGKLLINPNEAEKPCVTRFLCLPDTNLFNEITQYSFIKQSSLFKKALSTTYQFAYQNVPFILDIYRQKHFDYVKDSKTVKLGNEFIPEKIFDFDLINSNIDKIVSKAQESNKSTSLEVKAPEIVKPSKDYKVAWVAMHWLENGGAESWAFEQMRIAKENGYHVVLTVDRTSPQRLFEKAEKYADKIYLAGHVLAEEDWYPFVFNMIAEENITSIHIHHSVLAYTTIERIKDFYPNMFIVDTTHIKEYRGGGFVRDTYTYEKGIDLHHVISPQLRDLLLFDKGIDPKKVAYKPLTNFTKDEKRKAKKTPHQPLTVGFLGRLSLQKRPYLFVQIAQKLSKTLGNDIRFVLQGSGELQKHLNDQIDKYPKLNIDLRSWGSIDEFFEDVDILLITSENEGLTLTSLEADRHGVLVISSDVGSQNTVTAPPALISRYPLNFKRNACALIEKIVKNDDVRIELLKKQNELIDDLRSVQSAEEFFNELYSKKMEGK